MCVEIQKRSKVEKLDNIHSIYFGGGTPSILSSGQISILIETVYKYYYIDQDVEISLEANPENLSKTYIEDLKKMGINRLSIGVQSFHDADLASMNRVHSRREAIEAVLNALERIPKVSLDLIFGLPYSSFENWKQNLEMALRLEVPHISTYGLTVEEKTNLARRVSKQELTIADDDLLNKMYLYTLERLENASFENYEISNFAKKGFQSRGNKIYWTGIPYLGFGPSAHSFDGHTRRSNVSNLKHYIDSLTQNITFWTTEELSSENLYNEYILTRLRLQEGIRLIDLEERFGLDRKRYFINAMKPFLDSEHVKNSENKSYTLTAQGKLIADFITEKCMYTI